MKNKFNILIIILGISIGCFWSCSENFLDKESSTSLRPDQVNTLDDVNTLLNGAYDNLTSNSYYNNFYISKNDVRGDDMLSLSSSRLGTENRYEYEEYDSSSDMWSEPYTAIRQVNRVLEHLEKVEISDDQEALKNHIKGQSLTIRALAHFDLCKMYGKPYSFDKGASLGIPICLKVLDWNAKKSRNTVAEVYEQIKKDLEAAIPLLSEEREDGYLNRWGAKALLARVYLYMEENGDAFDIAEDIIQHSDYSLIPRDKYVNSWAEAFTTESIFSISNSLVDNGGNESIANYADPDGYYILAATKKFVDILDENDIRKELLHNDYYTIL